MTFTPVPNHPECKRWFLGVVGPVESRTRIIITQDFGKWSWRYKRAGERHYVYLGPVAEVRNVCEEIRLVELVASIY